MDYKVEKRDVGVIVGRFQVPYLHEAHIDLIRTVCSKHKKVVILLGVGHTSVTVNNPLDFESRKQMILEKFPNVNVLYIKDTKSDIDWSMILDKTIKDIVSPTQTVVLYGSRDSFLARYHGTFPTRELVPSKHLTGTEIRKDTAQEVKSSIDFRKGVIWAASNQYPKTYITIDAIILNDNNEILLAKKEYEKKYRLIGGFLDVEDINLEFCVKREVLEETGIEIDDVEYVCSFHVDDWRYRREKDRVMTILFKCKYIYGSPKANDDIKEVKWFDFDYVQSNFKGIIEEEHIGLLERYFFYEKRKKWMMTYKEKRRNITEIKGGNHE